MSLLSPKLLKRRPQELGKIKIGGKGAERTSAGGKGFRLPVKFDHFVVTTRHRGKDENFVKDMAIHNHPKVGEKPVELAGVLMYETPEENFHAEMVQYKGRTKVWTCNGEEATNLKTGTCGECPRLAGKDCACKPYARLHLQLWASPHVFGYHVFRTTGWESTNNIQNTLKEIYERFGTCYNAPVKLVLYPAEDRYMEGETEKTSTSYKVGLVLAMAMEEAAVRMVEAKRTMELARGELKQIAATVHQEQAIRDREEEADIAEEYFPEEATRASIETQERQDSLKAELGITVPPPPAPATAEQMDRLRKLVKQAPTLTTAEEDAITEVLDAKDASGVSMWLTELDRRMAEPSLEL